MSQKPSVGRIVIYREGDYELGAQHEIAGGETPEEIAAIGKHSWGTNGTREHPAIITRVWSDTCVNLRVFFDAGESGTRNSVTMLPALPEGTKDTSGTSGWKWPERT